MLAAKDDDELAATVAILTFLAQYPECSERLSPQLVQRALAAFVKGKGRQRKSKAELSKWDELAAVTSEMGIGGTKRLEQDWHAWRSGNSDQQEIARRRRTPEYAVWCKEAADEARARLRRTLRLKKKATLAT